MAEEVPTVRSAREIKAGLLKRAFANDRGPEMIALILERGRRAREVPMDHIEALCQIDDNQPRAVRMLNRIAEEEGSEKRFSDISGMKPPTSSIN